MRILLIEDDSNKSLQILDFLKSDEVEVELSIEHKRSYQSGLKAIFTEMFDFVLLDMQLPTFDIKHGEDGYKFRELAGMDIMHEVKRKKKKCQFIVITQFEAFGEGDDYTELEDLKKMLIQKFEGLYIDTVYYNPSQTNWKMELRQLIENRML